eukprot:1871111-Karenia_brevis.AAC.1
MRHIRSWQEKWIQPCQHGARQRHSTEDVYWQLALKIERAMLEDLPLYGFTLDYAKCFDQIPWDIMFRLAEQLGMSGRILKPVESMYLNLRRRFKYAGSCGR